MYTGMFLLKSWRKSGIGMKSLVGGWYRVAMIIFPVVVSTSMAKVSEMKSSNNL